MESQYVIFYQSLLFIGITAILMNLALIHCFTGTSKRKNPRKVNSSNLLNFTIYNDSNSQNQY